jgi:DNA polymerase III epsilon subunit-like protein
MKALEKELRGHDCLIFLDLEGTQFSHEMIEIGAYKVYLNKDQTVKKIFDGYTSYVKAKAKVGRVVTNLTGITDEKIKKDGVPFRVIQQGFRKYVGKDWGKCLYVTFGSHDLRIIMQSADNNMDASMEEARYVTHNALDLSEFISRFIKDENGNSLSLTNYLKVFNVPFEGKAHDALADAYNLIDLYKAFLAHPEIVEAEYKKVLAKMTHFPVPVIRVLQKLNKGETVTPDDYEKEIKESLK